MGILSRFTDIMSANINSLLEKAESKNADKILEKYLRDAKDNLEEVKAETAAIIADEMAAARKVGSLEEEIVKLSQYAEQAVIAGNDADATEFLEGKNKAVAQKTDAEKIYVQAKLNSDRMREMTRKLMGDITDAQSKLGELKSKLAVAQQTEKMNDLNEKMTSYGGMSDYGNLVDAVQKRIDAADAKSQLNHELDAGSGIDKLKEKYSVSDNAASTDITSELAALKAKLGK
ncbi:MAG: PspA/IM30 family protein [Oscillospiraceae bacterium]